MTMNQTPPMNQTSQGALRLRAGGGGGSYKGRVVDGELNLIWEEGWVFNKGRSPLLQNFFGHCRSCSALPVMCYPIRIYVYIMHYFGGCRSKWKESRSRNKQMPFNLRNSWFHSILIWRNNRIKKHNGGCKHVGSLASFVKMAKLDLKDTCWGNNIRLKRQLEKCTVFLPNRSFRKSLRGDEGTRIEHGWGEPGSNGKKNCLEMLWPNRVFHRPRDILALFGRLNQAYGVPHQFLSTKKNK